MPAAKKKKRKTAKPMAKMEKQVAQMSERMNMLLVVFAVGMMLLAYMLVKTYTM